MALALLFSTQIYGQSSNSCPGWHNPTTFVTTQNHTQYFYSGAVIESLNSSTGTGGMANHVGVDDIFYTNAAIVPDNQLATKVATAGCSSVIMSDGSNRFVIKSAASGNSGADPHTNYQLRFVPSALDNNGMNYTSSIRVGTECQYGSEVLYYQMRVTPQNSLLTVWYAPVIQAPGHTYDINPAFIIRVKHKVGNTWVQDNPNLDYVISGTPQSTSYPQGMQNNVNGWHKVGSGYDEVWYKDWTKVMISLNQYLRQDVRVEIYMSACKYNAHYAYAYIAGDSQPMQVTSSGCPSGRSTVVDTLRAPQDMISYSWYKSATGADVTGNVFNLTYLDSATNGSWIRTTLISADGLDTLKWVRVTNPSPDRSYLVDTADFIPTEGDSAGRMVKVQSFMCKMMSYMDPAKPFPSFVYQAVANNKPVLSIDTIPTCDGKIQLISTSKSRNMELDTTMTRWDIYENSQGTGTPLFSITGNSGTFQSTHASQYYAKLKCYTLDEVDHDTTCNTEDIFTIRTLETPRAVIGVRPTDEPCLGDTIQLVDSTFLGTNASNQYNGWQRTWIVDSNTVTGNAASPQVTYMMSMEATDTVTLIVRNGMSHVNRSNTSERVYCADTVRREIRVFTSPDLTVTGDTIVCVGSRTDAHIAADAEGCTYQWYYHYDRPGESSFASGADLQVEPSADTTTYYVKVTSAKGCVAWDSVKAYLVRPKLEMIPADGRICPDQTAMLIGSDAHHFSWTASPDDPGLAPQADRDTIVVSPDVTTTYTMTGHGSNDCPATPLQKTVKVIPYPIPAFTITPGFVDSEVPTVTFTDNSPYRYTTSWEFGDGESMGGQQATHTYVNLPSDSVYVTMTTANELGCASDTTFAIPVQLFSVWIPTAFTPDLATNSKFAIATANVLEYFSMYVYDRRGAQVFSSTDQNFMWDGTCNGEKCQQGAYAYICRYRRPGTEDIVVRKGTITLIR